MSVHKGPRPRPTHEPETSGRVGGPTPRPKATPIVPLPEVIIVDVPKTGGALMAGGAAILFLGAGLVGMFLKKRKH